jgi:glycosyltransferase involved in cell wall biosynthesis
MTPTISVVMPVHNGSRFIDEALASVAAQTMAPNEVVIVDDVSTDDTAERVLRWADRLPIRLARTPQRMGCGGARQQAIAMATGDTLAPLDSDDVWLPNHLATLVPLSAPDRIVSVWPIYWQPEMQDDSRHRSSPPATPPPPAQPGKIVAFNYLFSGSVAWRAPVARYAADCAQPLTDDWQRWIHLIVLGGLQVVSAPQPTLLYRQHAESDSANDGCLPGEIELLESLLAADGFAPYRLVISKALRRRRARVELLAAVASPAADVARRHYLQALRIDPSLAGGFKPGRQGSVALRALAGLAAPRLFVRSRSRHLRAKGLATAPAH